MLMLSCAALTMVLPPLSLLRVLLLHSGRAAIPCQPIARMLDSTVQVAGAAWQNIEQDVFIMSGFTTGDDLWRAEQAGAARDSTPVADVATCMAPLLNCCSAVRA
jgi:hypothetical protein